jgi:hypothetical protein
MERKFNMTSVGGQRDTVASTRRLNRKARAAGFRDAKAMYVAILRRNFAKMVEQQQQHPDVVGSLTPAEAA